MGGGPMSMLFTEAEREQGTLKGEGLNLKQAGLMIFVAGGRIEQAWRGVLFFTSV